MTDVPVFVKTGTPVDYANLSPGMYAVNCSDRFNADKTKILMQCVFLSGESELFRNAFVGMMLPYYLHNANNILVGVRGNLDLAEMFMPDTDKVGTKLSGAKKATDDVVSFLRTLAAAASSPEPDQGTKSAEILLKAACGRNVDAEGISEITCTVFENCRNQAMALAAFEGVAVWAVVSLGGVGSVSLSADESKLTLAWSRPENAGTPYMPGSSSGAQILGVAGGLAYAAGLALVVDEWTDARGEVSLALTQ